ncbi:MAG: hypothetical protein ACR2G5_14890 [Pyrinomonadaceae bacterium]
MASKEEGRRRDLDARLNKIEERFEHEMRERGFDPAQADNVALPGSLAKLYAEREELRAELQTDEQHD